MCWACSVLQRTSCLDQAVPSRPSHWRAFPAEACVTSTRQAKPTHNRQPKAQVPPNRTGRSSSHLTPSRGPALPLLQTRRLQPKCGQNDTTGNGDKTWCLHCVVAGGPHGLRGQTPSLCHLARKQRWQQALWQPAPFPVSQRSAPCCLQPSSRRRADWTDMAHQAGFAISLWQPNGWVPVALRGSKSPTQERWGWNLA